MELAAGALSHWVVTLMDGSEVDVWADGVSGISERTCGDPHIVFVVLTNIDTEDQDRSDVTARTSGSPCRVEVAVARFPRVCVRDVRSLM